MVGYFGVRCDDVASVIKLGHRTGRVLMTKKRGVGNSDRRVLCTWDPISREYEPDISPSGLRQLCLRWVRTDCSERQPSGKYEAVRSPNTV